MEKKKRGRPLVNKNKHEVVRDYLRGVTNVKRLSKRHNIPANTIYTYLAELPEEKRKAKFSARAMEVAKDINDIKQKNDGELPRGTITHLAKLHNISKQRVSAISLDLEKYLI